MEYIFNGKRDSFECVYSESICCKSRSFRPDFVLVRQYVRDSNVDWINIILGMQYGAVPSINSMRALYNFQDKPWIVRAIVLFD